MESVFHRCAPDDPSRCQGVGKFGQCPFLAIGTRANGAAPWDGIKYCHRHQGASHIKERNKEARTYLVAKYQERIGFKATDPKIKSLREEMGILRMLLETKLNAVTDDTELLMQSGQISNLVQNIGQLIKVAHHIEKDMNILLDKSQAEQWVGELGEIIGRYIEDPEILSMISEDMIESLERRTHE